MTAEAPRSSRSQNVRRKARATKSWAGYGWFMTGGTFFPLPVFLGGYLVHVTLVGAPAARRIYGYGLFLSTMGQRPPGEDRLKKKAAGSTDEKSFAERIRPYSPPGLVERRGRPVPRIARAVWFVLVGWWLGAVWVVLAWSVLLLPYPLLDAIRGILGDLPSVMTLATPTGKSGLTPSEASAGA
jgi:uncharacterized membrane protein YccF (DUF307 family)